jgi:vacuolar protein sorting-associated protein 54
LFFQVDSDIFLLPADHALVTSKLSSLLDAVCNYCHERCANLVSNQSLEKSTPTIEQLVRLTNIVTAFTGGCEKICGVQCHALQSALKVQGTRFAQKFHAERKSKLALLLDSERWRQADVPAEFQKIIDNIAKDEFSWPKTPSSLPGAINNPTAPPSPVLIIDGQPYALVGAALILVQIVSEYCHCATQLPQISAQISRNIIDLLRTFNSRCCQLVLGAGALHLAGLKTITSTNLALVSRALQLVLWLLPHIKSHFRSFDINGNTTLPNGTAFSGYETVEKDFISHIKEVENKILMIVVTLLTNQLDNWEAKPPVPSQSFRTISRHFVKLHEAIAPILPEQQVHNIYRTVNKNFKDKLREQLLKNNIANNGGPQHGVVISELTFYLETLRTLKTMPVAELNDNSMNDIWL